MSLQSIINKCNAIQIDRRKVVGIQYTRNEIPRISITPTKNPWRFTITMPNSYRYSDARSVMEALDRLDRAGPETITFSNRPEMNWIFRYQGVMTPAQINNITVSSFTGDQLVLTGLPAISSSSVLFEPNDLIQIGTNPYPFTSTGQVLRGSAGTVTITTNRPNIITASVAGAAITVGAGCQFRVFCPNMPTYKLIVGGQFYSGSTLINNAYIEFSDDFVLYEYVASA